MEEQNTIMLPIATVTEAKENSCIFIPGLLVTVRRLLLLKCSHPDHQQQSNKYSKLTSDLAATTDADKVQVFATSEWMQWRIDGRWAYSRTSLVRCMMCDASTVCSQACRDHV